MTTYMVYFGFSVSIQDLGFDNMNVNGIYFGLVQSMAYLVMTFFSPKMKRKLWLLIFQGLTILFTISLFFLSTREETNIIKYAKAFISIFVLGFFNAAIFPLLFSFISELFPTRVRGIAFAFITFLGRFGGSYAPFLAQLSKDSGYHVMCGCASLTAVSFPMIFFLQETLVLPKSKKKEEITMKDSQSQNYLTNHDKSRESSLIEDID